MSLKTHKILIFIPIVNIFFMFFFIYFYLKSNLPMSRFLKNIFKVFGLLILVNLPEMILNIFFQIHSDILFWITAYLCFLSFGLVFVKDEEKYYKEK